MARTSYDENLFLQVGSFLAPKDNEIEEMKWVFWLTIKQAIKIVTLVNAKTTSTIVPYFCPGMLYIMLYRLFLTCKQLVTRLFLGSPKLFVFW